jgi:hypothetical protein
MNLKEFKELSHTSDKIYKFVRQNLRTLVSSSLYQKSTVLPALIIFTFLCLILETVKYPGFMGNHFFIDARIYFAVVLTLIFFSTSKSRFSDFILKINRFLLPVLSITYLSLAALEGAHYTNYVLATLRIHLDGLVLLVLFSLLLFLADKFKDLLPKRVHGLGVIYPAMVFFIIYFVVRNLSYVTDQAVNRNFYIVFHLSNSYDQRMYYQWGDFYRFMTFVKNNTPVDATIIGPPEEDPWLMGSGNDRFVRVFLYPRKIISATKIIPDIKVFGPNTYLLITWGKEECQPTGCHGWPRQDIPAKKIFYKDPDSEKVIETKENVIYKLEDDKYVYGLIKL